MAAPLAASAKLIYGTIVMPDTLWRLRPRLARARAMLARFPQIPAAPAAAMKLLLINTEFPPGPGGIGTHAMQIGAQLSALGWEVTAATPQDYAPAGEIEAFNAPSPFNVVRLRHIPGPPFEALYRYLTVARIIRDWKPDVMLATGERSVWLARTWRASAERRGWPWAMAPSSALRNDGGGRSTKPRSAWRTSWCARASTRARACTRRASRAAASA